MAGDGIPGTIIGIAGSAILAMLGWLNLFPEFSRGFFLIGMCGIVAACVLWIAGKTGGR